MTIHQLFEREDIYSIIENTLKAYYKDIYGVDAEVKLSKNRLCNSFVVYPRIGVIVSRVPSWDVMKHVYDDFNVQGNILRKSIAWSYITLCWFTFGLLGSRTLYVSDKKLLNRNISIMPCNRKIRIFDFKKGYVDAILKTGYPDTFFKKEIEARTKLDYSFIPGIEKIGERWYREKVLDGNGLVRVGKHRYERYCNEVVEDIRQLFEDYGYEIPAVEYAVRLGDELRDGLDIIQGEKGVKDLDYIRGVLNYCIDILNGSDMIIPITMSHGDLQTGNILVDEKRDKVTIYDWETIGMRSVWFDCSRLLLYSVRRNHFIYLANNYEDDKIKKALLLLDKKKDRDMKQVMAVLILEDMKYKVSEIESLPGNTGVEDIYVYENKLKEITWLN